jgi:N utilization substance protein A
MVVNVLRGEKIDIVPFSEDLADFVAKALSPAKVKEVIISDDLTQADVIVPDQQLSLAIGKEGQNARLAARLTGVRIDIRGESQPLEVDDDVVYEEGEWVQNAETGEMEWHAADGSIITQQEWNAQAEGAADEAAPEAAAEEPATGAQADQVTETEATEAPEATAANVADGGGDDA